MRAAECCRHLQGPRVEAPPGAEPETPPRCPRLVPGVDVEVCRSSDLAQVPDAIGSRDVDERAGLEVGVGELEDGTERQVGRRRQGKLQRRGDEILLLLYLVKVVRAQIGIVSCRE